MDFTFQRQVGYPGQVKIFMAKCDKFKLPKTSKRSNFVVL